MGSEQPFFLAGLAPALGVGVLLHGAAHSAQPVVSPQTVVNRAAPPS